MSEFFEYDPMTGIKTETAWSESEQKMTVIRSADVEPVLDFTKELAADTSVTQRGMKDNWWLYAKLPPIVILQLRAKGINVFDKNDQKRMFQEINANYKWLKCTTKDEFGKAAMRV